MANERIPVLAKVKIGDNYYWLKDAEARELVADLGERVDDLEATSATKEELAAVEKLVEDETKRAEEVESGLRTDLTTAQGNITDLQGRVGTLEADIQTKANSADVYLKTETYNQTEIDAKIAAIKSFEIVVVDELPTASETTLGKLYLVPSEDPEEQNIKDEFITVKSGEEEPYTYSWEKIGSTKINLNNYYTKDEVDALILASHAKLFEAGSFETLPTTGVKQGDIGLVKETISGDLKQHTAYIYDNNEWKALDGNYSAENVYFKEDLTYTAAIGVLPKPSGSATIAAAGKNIKQVLSSIIAKREQPSKTDPVASISGTQSNEDLEIGSNVSKSGTMTGSLSAGSYTYGPATGITATGWSTEVKYTAGKTGSIATGTSTSTPYSYSFQMGTDGETIKVYFKVSATHDAGAVAVDNLGDPSNPEVKIAAGTKSKDATATYTCYRKMFYGTFANKDAMTSATIRSTLTGVKAAAKSDNSLAVTIPVGALRVVIAVPAGRSVTSIKDKNGVGAEIFSSFSTTTVAVEGANGYTAANYTVYYLDYANPNDKANQYDVTIA